MTLLPLALILATPVLPAPDIPGLPGWLGLVTHAPVAPGEPQVQTRYGFLPEDATAEIVIPTDAWADVPTGVVLTAISDWGDIPATFQRAGALPYGCDGGSKEVARFDTEGRPDEGVAWLIPREDLGNGTSLPVEELPAAEAGLRQWKVGEMRLSIRATGRMTAALELRRDEALLLARSIVKEVMAGAEDRPLDLKGDREIAVPYPILGVTWEGLEWIVLVTQGYEGVSFQAIVVRHGKATWEEGGYLYSCAF